MLEYVLGWGSWSPSIRPNCWLLQADQGVRQKINAHPTQWCAETWCHTPQEDCSDRTRDVLDSLRKGRCYTLPTAWVQSGCNAGHHNDLPTQGTFCKRTIPIHDNIGPRTTIGNRWSRWAKRLIPRPERSNYNCSIPGPESPLGCSLHKWYSRPHSYRRARPLPSISMHQGSTRAGSDENEGLFFVPP